MLFRKGYVLRHKFHRVLKVEQSNDQVNKAGQVGEVAQDKISPRVKQNIPIYYILDAV